MKKRVVFSILLFSSIVFAAAPRPHVIDPAHSQINFIADAKLISAHGSFDKWEADVQLNAEKVEESSVKIIIDAASINTRVPRRDDHLRSKDFFWVEQYPQITFVSKKISKTGDRKYNIVGDMTLRGVTKELEIPVEMVFYENNRGRFRSTFQISRSAFGITFDSRMNSIADLVTVQFDINTLDKEAMEKMQRPKSGSN